MTLLGKTKKRVRPVLLVPAANSALVNTLIRIVLQEDIYRTTAAAAAELMADDIRYNVWFYDFGKKLPDVQMYAAMDAGADATENVEAARLAFAASPKGAPDQEALARAIRVAHDALLSFMAG
jgi:hypothetical protein